MFAEKLHSIYIYGSVGRGEAVAYKSDLDLTVIVKSPTTLAEKNELNEKTLSLLRRHKEIIKIDYDIGESKEALAQENLYEWGFWLRHMCTCIYGEDISTTFPRMKANEKISAALNRDLFKLTDFYRQALNNENMPEVTKRTILKRIIRGAYLKINVEDESWSTKVDENLMILQLHFPNEELFEKIKLIKSSDKPIKNSELIEILEKFKLWLKNI
ncbi:nucleotidyltransferase domain-containing protein [Amphibacillus jilinensis]|uniref:nucleotidyltransferase domain-containing protein n=1 Tax=Amphibacillus jilinensis TaxID=1216008 RepID=UPI0003117F1F|nr:nucleotidyltransferase domain-containing protein [Amphibacillus jilinensis]